MTKLCQNLRLVPKRKHLETNPGAEHVSACCHVSAPDQRVNWMDPHSSDDGKGYHPGTKQEFLENADSRSSKTLPARQSETSFRPGHVAGPRPRPEVFHMSVDSDSCLTWGSPAANGPTPRSQCKRRRPRGGRRSLGGDGNALVACYAAQAEVTPAGAPGKMLHAHPACCAYGLCRFRPGLVPT